MLNHDHYDLTGYEKRIYLSGRWRGNFKPEEDVMGGIKVTAADRRFTKQIRERDDWTCQYCGREFAPDNAQGLDTAHIFGRACKVCTAKRKGSTPEHYCTRLDLDNAMALCTGDHFWFTSHPAAWIEFCIKHLGQERFEALADRAHSRRDR